ncbi:MAG: DMT family transporter [Candidatus Gottesmanbacteria bacterium]|nr:DMT family transporter [Candidatus Gottesmanbacteria bacterium]
MIYGLIAMFGWGISNFFSGRLSKFIGFLPALITGTVGTIACLIFIMVTGNLPVKTPQSNTLGLLIIAGGLLSIAGLSFYKGLEVGKISLLSPIAASWPMGIAIIAVATNQSPFSPAKLIGMLLVTAGVLAASVKRIDKNISFSDPGIPYALVALATWIGAFYFFGRTLAGSSWALFNVLFLCISVLFEMVYARWKNSPVTWKPTRKTLWYLAGCAVPSALAFYFYSVGMRSAENSTVAIATNANPVITVLLALLFLRERLNRRQLTGIAMVVIGLILTGR